MNGGGCRRVAVYGTGEAAELAYVSINELGFQMAAVFEATGGGQFLGQRVLAIADHHQVAFDLLLVATLDRADPILQELERLQVPRDRVVVLR